MALHRKHGYAALVIGGFSGVIYWINRAWGVGVPGALVLASQTFGMFFLGVLGIWEIQDHWHRRWERRGRPPCDQLETRAVEIPLASAGAEGAKDLKLVGTLVWDARHPLDPARPAPCVILCHGYSDTRRDVAFLAEGLALAGFVVLTYDARGHGASKHIGSRNNLTVKYHHDFQHVVTRAHAIPGVDPGQVHAMGASMGGSTALIGGINDSRVAKIVALATVSNFRENISRHPVPLSREWWVRLLYGVKGMTIYPDGPENEKISPLLQVQHFMTERGARGTHSPPESLGRRLLLVHAKDDKIISWRRAVENAAAASLPPDHLVLLDWGGHMFLKQEAFVVALVARFLQPATGGA